MYVSHNVPVPQGHCSASTLHMYNGGSGEGSGVHLDSCRGQPGRYGVEGDAILVVGVDHMVGGKPQALMRNCGCDHPRDHIHRGSVKVGPGAVGGGVEGLWRDACVGNAAEEPREEVCGVDLALVPATGAHAVPY